MSHTASVVRIDAEYLRQADAIKEALQQQEPGLTYTRMDVLRMALTRGFAKLVTEKKLVVEVEEGT